MNKFVKLTILFKMKRAGLFLVLARTLAREALEHLGARVPAMVSFNPMSGGRSQAAD